MLLPFKHTLSVADLHSLNHTYSLFKLTKHPLRPRRTQPQTGKYHRWRFPSARPRLSLLHLKETQRTRRREKKKKKTFNTCFIQEGFAQTLPVCLKPSCFIQRQIEAATKDPLTIHLSQCNVTVRNHPRTTLVHLHSATSPL